MHDGETLLHDEPYLEGWLEFNLLGPCTLDTATNQFQVGDSTLMHLLFPRNEQY